MIRHKSLGLATLLAATLIFASSWMAIAGETVSVSSTTDGHGLYSYTFELGSQPYVWGLQSNNGNIFIKSHGILEVISPPGWIATVDTREFITWQPTNGLVFVGQPPLTFSVISSNTNSILYVPSAEPDPVYPAGIIGGSLYTIPDHQGVALGYETFSFLGPQLNSPCFLNIRSEVDAVVLSWTNAAFALQIAPSPAGTYTNVVGAISPFTNSVSGIPAYFRLILN